MNVPIVPLCFETLFIKWMISIGNENEDKDFTLFICQLVKVKSCFFLNHQLISILTYHKKGTNILSNLGAIYFCSACVSLICLLLVLLRVPNTHSEKQNFWSGYGHTRYFLFWHQSSLPPTGLPMLLGCLLNYEFQWHKWAKNFAKLM